MLPLFVYGSLIDPVHRAEVLGHFADAVPATLHGFERGRSRYWFIRPCDGARLDGFLLTGLDEHDYATLDAYEEVPALSSAAGFIFRPDGRPHPITDPSPRLVLPAV